MKKTFLCLSVILLIGCSTTVPQRTKLMEQLSPEDVTAFDIRVRLNNYATFLSSRIEKAADEIASKSEDPLIRENALLWKMNAILTSSF